MDNLLLGLSTALIGMIVVFAGLVILILCIVLLTKISSASGKRSKKTSSQNAASGISSGRPNVSTADAVNAAAKNSDEVDNEILAVISAAVACMFEKEGNEGSSFFVKRIQRIQNAPAWQKNGREEQIYTHS